MLTLWQFFEKIFQSNQQKFSKKQQKQKQKRKSKKMAKIKQVNTLLKLLHLYLSIYYSILLQKNNNHWKNAVVWFRPSVFCKKIIKKEILLALLCTEEYCFKKNIQWIENHLLWCTSRMSTKKPISKAIFYKDLYITIYGMNGTPWYNSEKMNNKKALLKNIFSCLPPS